MMGWGAVTVLILIVPLVAMQFTDEVDWTLSDFVIAGILLFGAGLAYELVSRRGNTAAYRTAVGFAVGGVLLLLWVNGAVGILGSEDNPVNVMYAGVPIIGVVGALLARFRPLGMARALFAMALAQALIPVIAYIVNRPQITLAELTGVIVIHAIFIMFFVVSALLFRRAYTKGNVRRRTERMPWEEVITFWFEECSPEQWFTKDQDLDAEIRSRFLDTYHAAAGGDTEHWRSTPEGRLAEVIVLDQFARNMFRDTPQAFAQDSFALSLAEEAVRAGDDKKLPPQQRHFLYMPYMHSESTEVHETGLELFESLGGEAEEYEKKHKEIVDRFGRYPHRNEILGRTSTPEELEFMKRHPGF